MLIYQNLAGVCLKEYLVVNPAGLKPVFLESEQVQEDMRLSAITGTSLIFLHEMPHNR